MVNYESDFWDAVRNSIDLLKAKGVPTTLFTSSNGHSLQGWLVERWPENTDGVGPGGTPLERWHTEVVLSEDGKFHLYSVEWTYGEGETRSLQPHSELVGWEGKPFSKVKEQIERLPYR